MSAADKAEVFALGQRHLAPARQELFRAVGIDLVIGRRLGYRFSDLDGRPFIDLHLNGGTFNLGHRNPEVIAALIDALDEVDLGNHHLPSEARARCAKALAEACPGDLDRVVFASGGGEAVDIAIKTARHATRRRRIVSFAHGYHGHTGLALAAGEDRYSAPFLSGGAADEFTRVPSGDLDAVERELRRGDVAAVLVETLPATAGFPLPPPGYLPGLARACRAHGALYLADEVQTGLGRSGRLWAVETYDVLPDLLVTAKGLSGGIYPIAATVISERAAGWLRELSHGHVSTFGGAELGCRVAERVLAITRRADTIANVARLSAAIAADLADIQARSRGFLAEVRQHGLVIGLKTSRPDGAVHLMRALYDAGVWAVFAAHDPSVLQWKPGLLWDDALRGEVSDRLDRAVAACAARF
jgi:acetylornithine/succinyldiaminopimelate/putrescine aminotransferase